MSSVRVMMTMIENNDDDGNNPDDGDDLDDGGDCYHYNDDT